MKTKYVHEAIFMYALYVQFFSECTEGVFSEGTHGKQCYIGLSEKCMKFISFRSDVKINIKKGSSKLNRTPF